jgi:hypothetical protein
LRCYAIPPPTETYAPGQAVPLAWLALYTPYLRQHGLEELRDAIMRDHGRHRIPQLYTFYTRDSIPDAWQAAYEPYLRQHGLEVLKNQIMADHGYHRISDVYTLYRIFPPNPKR